MTTPRLGVWWLVAVGLVAGIALVLSGAERLRLGGYVIAASMGAAGMLRLLLPSRLTGGLRVRSRATDTAMLLLLAVGVAVLTTVVELHPAR
ncbi:MAG TPA: DUF3017 domain-containing protein [Dermatophilaceae bacterium]|nr:DUF3017 domain-containing protein [Dermatophilaceae bacterium]